MGYDYGKDDAWLALRTHCAEAREPQYTYRMCLFDRAAQVDNNAGHETKLGTWKGFEKGYTEVGRSGGGRAWAVGGAGAACGKLWGASCCCRVEASPFLC